MDLYLLTRSILSEVYRSRKSMTQRVKDSDFLVLRRSLCRSSSGRASRRTVVHPPLLTVRNVSNAPFVVLSSCLQCLALFGTELEQRAEYERVGIPGIVQRCIQEVELRGMLEPLKMSDVPISCRY